MATRSSALRDTLTLVVAFAFLLGGLFLYTGTWPPAVIVESSSMMHPDSEVTYGRSWITFGPATIDPGDLVLVKDIDAPADVTTLVEGGRDRYGLPGDVIVYYADGERAETPIIHRAVAYVDVRGTGDSAEYWLRWDPEAPCVGGAVKREETWCVYGSDGVYVPSVPIQALGSTPSNPRPFKPQHDGFITKGDNPSSNRQIDQVSGLSEVVRLEWVEGKGRGELPWLGLIKLSLADRPNERNPAPEWVKIGSAYAPKDLWVMLGITMFVLVGVPLLYDGYKAYQQRRPPRPTYQRVEQDHTPTTSPGPAPVEQGDDADDPSGAPRDRSTPRDGA